MNAPRFKRVLDHIKANPETWDQKKVSQTDSYCFLCHASVMSGVQGSRHSYTEAGESWLDITNEEYYYLFSTTRTIADFDRFYQEHGGI